METQVDEIADGIYRLSTFVEMAGLRFNQYLVDAEEPLLFHTGQRHLFELTSEAAARVRPVEDLRWISWGHLESDESGAMNQWLGAAPQAEVAVGFMAGILSVNDLADRPPRLLGDDEVIDLGGKRVRFLPTPHVPHGWDAGLLFEETTGTLLCGDLFTQQGDGPATASGDIIGLVNSGFGAGEQWDDQYDGMAEGWQLFLANLQLHMEHFRGQTATAVLPMAMWAGPRADAWASLCAALGTPATPAVGERIATSGDAPPLTGTVVSAATWRLALLLEEPAPGTAFIAAEGDGPVVGVSVWSYLYGEAGAAAAATSEPLWREWLTGRGVGPEQS